MLFPVAVSLSMGGNMPAPIVFLPQCTPVVYSGKSLAGRCERKLSRSGRYKGKAAAANIVVAGIGS